MIRIEWMDGTRHDVRPDKWEIHDGILTVTQNDAYGLPKETHLIPLGNVRAMVIGK